MALPYKEQQTVSEAVLHFVMQEKSDPFKKHRVTTGHMTNAAVIVDPYQAH